MRARHDGVLRVEPAAPDTASGFEARMAVQAALGRLGARARAIVVLRELEGIEVAEIARMLGVARVTVRWHLAAARRKLRRILLPAEPALAGDAKRKRTP